VPKSPGPAHPPSCWPSQAGRTAYPSLNRAVTRAAANRQLDQAGCARYAPGQGIWVRFGWSELYRETDSGAVSAGSNPAGGTESNVEPNISRHGPVLTCTFAARLSASLRTHVPECLCPGHAGARRHDRQRRLAQHATLAAHSHAPPELGGQLLRARVRRAAAGRRPGRPATCSAACIAAGKLAETISKNRRTTHGRIGSCRRPRPAWGPGCG
jgi:hypothetical protein